MPPASETRLANDEHERGPRAGVRARGAQKKEGGIVALVTGPSQSVKAVSPGRGETARDAGEEKVAADEGTPVRVRDVQGSGGRNETRASAGRRDGGGCESSRAGAARQPPEERTETELLPAAAQRTAAAPPAARQSTAARARTAQGAGGGYWAKERARRRAVRASKSSGGTTELTKYENRRQCTARLEREQRSERGAAAERERAAERAGVAQAGGSGGNRGAADSGGAAACLTVQQQEPATQAAATPVAPAQQCAEAEDAPTAAERATCSTMGSGSTCGDHSSGENSGEEDHRLDTERTEPTRRTPQCATRRQQHARGPDESRGFALQRTRLQPRNAAVLPVTHGAVTSLARTEAAVAKLEHMQELMPLAKMAVVDAEELVKRVNCISVQETHGGAGSDAEEGSSENTQPLDKEDLWQLQMNAEMNEQSAVLNLALVDTGRKRAEQQIREGMRGSTTTGTNEPIEAQQSELTQSELSESVHELLREFRQTPTQEPASREEALEAVANLRSLVSTPTEANPCGQESVQPTTHSGSTMLGSLEKEENAQETRDLDLAALDQDFEHVGNDESTESDDEDHSVSSEDEVSDPDEKPDEPAPLGNMKGNAARPKSKRQQRRVGRRWAGGARSKPPPSTPSSKKRKRQEEETTRAGPEDCSVQCAVATRPTAAHN